MTSDLTTEAPPQAAEVAPGRTDKPLVEIDSGRGGLSRAALAELWSFREVLMAFAVRFTKIKYKQAAIGVGWAVLQPLLSALIFALIFGHFAHFPSEGGSYVLFALTGMVAWTYFSTSVTTASQSLVDEQSLLRKVYFPRETLPLGAIGAGLVDLAAGLAVLLVALTIGGRFPTIAWIFLPVPLLVLIAMASAAGLSFGALNVYYRDARYTLPFLLQIGLFVSAVIYPLSLFPEGLRTIWSVVNPVVGAIEALRAILIRGDWPQMGIIWGALAWSLLLLLVSYMLFKRLERAFSDRV
jgi:lipopolysaccharide transport system permease protein